MTGSELMVLQQREGRVCCSNGKRMETWKARSSESHWSICAFQGVKFCSFANIRVKAKALIETNTTLFYRPLPSNRSRIAFGMEGTGRHIRTQDLRWKALFLC